MIRPAPPEVVVRNAIAYNDGWICHECTDDPKGKAHFMGHNPDGLCPVTGKPGYFAKLLEEVA